jgi:hypothetical protein
MVVETTHRRFPRRRSRHQQKLRNFNRLRILHARACNKVSPQFQWLLVFGRGGLSFNILGIVTIFSEAAMDNP